MLTIPFDLSIYSQAAIHDALLTYRAFCQITAKFTENQCICTLRQSKYDMQQTAYEFANYVLSSTVGAAVLRIRLFNGEASSKQYGLVISARGNRCSVLTSLWQPFAC